MILGALFWRKSQGFGHGGWSGPLRSQEWRYYICGLKNERETHWKDWTRDTVLGIMGNCMELKAMGQSEIYYRRRGLRAKMWVLQHLEKNQRRRHCLGDGEGMAWGQPETQSVVQQQPGEGGFSKASPAEYRWKMDKHEDRWAIIGFGLMNAASDKTASVGLGDRRLRKLGSERMEGNEMKTMTNMVWRQAEKRG